MPEKNREKDEIRKKKKKREKRKKKTKNEEQKQKQIITKEKVKYLNFATGP